jgi:hypothetical protein
MLKSSVAHAIILLHQKWRQPVHVWLFHCLLLGLVQLQAMMLPLKERVSTMDFATVGQPLLLALRLARQ